MFVLFFSFLYEMYESFDFCIEIEPNSSSVECTYVGMYVMFVHDFSHQRQSTERL